MSERLSIDPAHLTEASGALLEHLRATSPLVHCITNSVVTNFTANALLALGAAPAMVDIVGEAGLFAGAANGMLVNLGTPNPEQRDAAREAAPAAHGAGTPWVLDPVAVGALPIRTALARELLEFRPTAIRGNASEVLALAGAGAGGRGVDASDETDAAGAAAARLADGFGSTVAVSGPVDLVTDGVRCVRIANGDALLTRVTGGGCALGAVTAAFLAAARATDAGLDDLGATAAATLVYTVAAELAAAGADGPGSFAVAFLDALASVDANDLAARARVEVGTLAVQAAGATGAAR
ncbi:hydroxyethylthiazole kinase [Agromyces marinus]|uniref:Hydroxyethylthiazole kinase n=1 Tax=Agromyces marinus TaxID=1389020 RepID=A0ABN6YHD0_9MICO|nr:hydroxyethylthiazole kinase [Agromyces marinus]BDZ55307.1 hydroxyethylthiazole kinase [Agromyces marinus]